MKLLAILIVFLSSSSVMALAPFKIERFKDFDSLGGTSTTWANETGSIMTIDMGLDGSVSGYYVNNTPGAGCSGLPYDLKGHAAGRMIAFSVVWANGVADCDSATAWAGYARMAEGGTVQIVTQWSLAFIGAARGEMQTGSNLFTYRSQSAQFPLPGR